MSLNFVKDGVVIWDPGMLSGRILLAQARGLEPLVGKSCGISEVIKGDTYEIDGEELREYSAVLLDWYFSTRNPISKSMLIGVLKICVVLAERAGAPVEIFPEDAMERSLEERHSFELELEAQKKLM